jgi:hypothetical protein
MSSYGLIPEITASPIPLQRGYQNPNQYRQQGQQYEQYQQGQQYEKYQQGQQYEQYQQGQQGYQMMSGPPGLSQAQQQFQIDHSHFRPDFSAMANGMPTVQRQEMLNQPSTNTQNYGNASYVLSGMMRTEPTETTFAQYLPPNSRVPPRTSHPTTTTTTTTTTTGSPNNIRVSQPVFQDGRDQMIWLQYFNQFHKYATPEEFAEYRRLYLQQFQDIDEQIYERQFTLTDTNDPLASNREDVMRWIWGVDDMSTHVKDRWTQKYEQYGDPMAQFITSKAWK